MNFYLFDLGVKIDLEFNLKKKRNYLIKFNKMLYLFWKQ